MSLKVVSLFSQFTRPRNWSNQELAEFYRVEASLCRAGIEIETEQGLSDEGDPWFIFCRAETGDVIIHFARIDGLYVVASPAFGSCVRGRDFRTLIEGLMEQHPVVMPREKEKGKFFIHPAALLVALVTTAFFKLCQGDALAAEGSDEHSATLLPGSVAGSAQRAAATAQSQMIALDERSAAILMVAVAVAVAWEQVTGTTETDALVTHVAQADALNLSLASLDRELPAIHPTSEDAGSQPTHAASFEQTPDQLHSSDSQVVALTPTVTQAKVEVVAPSVKASEDGDGKVAHDVMPVAGTSELATALPTAERVTPPATEHTPTATAPVEQQIASTEGAKSSAALVEVKAVVGELLQAHLSNTLDAEQQMVLTLISNGAGAHIGGPVQLSAAELDVSLPIQTVLSTQETTEQSTFAAVTATTPAAAATISVDDAIYNFMAIHTDFQIIKLDQEVIIYDPGLTPSNVKDALQETFSFADGSSVLLIGLPYHVSVPVLI